MENQQNMTIKERREQKRQEKLLKKDTLQKKEETKKVFLWPTVIVVLLVIVFGIVMLVKNSPKGPQIDIPVAIMDSISDTEWVRGNRNASTTLIEYGDFVCPACGQYYPIVKKLEDDFKDDVKFVFRNFPLPSHGNARIAARAAESAGVQGKFFEMHDLLYENQKEWSTASSAKAIFEGYATTLNLDMEQYKKDFESKEIGQKIDEDVRTGNSYGVNATPTFFLNNTKLSPKNYDELKKLLSDDVSPKS